MKRYILMIMYCAATMMTYAQYADCIKVNEFSPTISRWGEDYIAIPEEFQCWEVDLGVQGHAKITYNIDLETIAYYDYVYIYEVDENGNNILLRSFFGCTASGSIITNSTTGKIKIEYLGIYGNCNGLFDGFQIRIEQATCCDLVNHDHYILGKLGVGTTNPQEQLHVNGNLRLTSSYGNLTIGQMDTNYVRFTTDRAAYNLDKPLYVRDIKSDVPILNFYTRSSNNCMTLHNGRVGIGTINPQYKLDVTGTIRAREIIVETTGADYVFAEDYQLRSLSDVKAFISKYKHLPEIKSAQEMQENGVSVSELQTQLLQKIEELTLYILQQEERILELRQEVEQLKK